MHQVLRQQHAIPVVKADRLGRAGLMVDGDAVDVAAAGVAYDLGGSRSRVNLVMGFHGLDRAVIDVIMVAGEAGVQRAVAAAGRQNHAARCARYLDGVGGG